MKNLIPKKQFNPAPVPPRWLEVLKAAGPFFVGAVQLFKMALDHWPMGQ